MPDVSWSLPDVTNINMWMSLLTLTFLEIVLGIDNIIFVSIVANKLPKHDRGRARQYGLLLAMLFRIVLLLGIGFILSLNKPIFTLPFKVDNTPLGISIKDLILIGGGLFLLYKTTSEIHEKIEKKNHSNKEEKKSATMSSITSAILEICMVNIIFSFDSILTAMGMTQEIIIMMLAVVFSILIMIKFSSPVSHFINKHPTIQMLALAFLILIGVILIAEGLHQHVSKGYIYFAIAFSLGVEMLNLRAKNEIESTDEG